MIIDRKIDKAYESVSGSQYDKDGNLPKIIGLFHFLINEFDPSQVNDVNHDVGEKKVFIYLSNGERGEIDCSSTPEYEIKESVIHWVKERLELCEEKHGLKFFKELPRNKVKGKLI